MIINNRGKREKYNSWTEEEIQILKDNYKIMDIHDLTNILKRNPASVISKAYNLGLQKNRRLVNLC